MSSLIQGFVRWSSGSSIVFRIFFTKLAMVPSVEHKLTIPRLVVSSRKGRIVGILCSSCQPHGAALTHRPST